MDFPADLTEKLILDAAIEENLPQEYIDNYLFSGSNLISARNLSASSLLS